jgi:opacity protein-like surface antigen
MRILPLLALFAMAASSPLTLAGQTAPQHEATKNNEIFGGYSYSLRAYDHTQDNPVSGGMNGWEASAKFALMHSKLLGIKADASGYYRTDNYIGESFVGFRPRAYFFLAGPQISLPMGRCTVFADVLVGEGHLNSNDQSIASLASNFAFSEAAGGGVDVNLTHRLAWRVGGEFLHSGFSSSDNQIHGYVSSNGRIASGIVVRF